MVFSSIVFLVFFFPAFLFIYHVASDRYKNAILLGSSLIFYAWGAPKFIYILLPLTAIDFFIVKRMYKLPSGFKKKCWLAGSILINLGILGYFKYSNFFIENVNFALTKLGMTQVGWTNVVLPIGISFFCFETLTYSIDAYRGVIKPLNRLTDYYLYIFLFPKLIAGPIVKFNLIENQINPEGRKVLNEDFVQGFSRFIIGLSKKILIANVMAKQADVFLGDGYLNLNSTTAWLGMLAYTMQIYFDFSGYSDMAIGIGRMLGFKFPENFDNPYTSKSITEFWRRWHITLGSWMKEYLYIPLGGSRVDNKFRLLFNLWFVFLISGLWHGASWNFVIWGAFHGAFLIMDRLFLQNLLNKAGKFFATAFTFICVVFGWVFFRMETIGESKYIIKKMLLFDFNPIPFYENREFIILLGIALLLSFITSFDIGKKLQQKVYYAPKPAFALLGVAAVSSVVLFICLGRLTASDFNPFIYFRF